MQTEIRATRTKAALDTIMETSVRLAAARGITPEKPLPEIVSVRQDRYPEMLLSVFESLALLVRAIEADATPAPAAPVASKRAAKAA